MSSCCQKPESEIATPADLNNSLWLRLALSILLGGLSMYLSLGVNISNPEGTTRTILHSLLAIISGGVIIGIGSPMLRSAWLSARAMQITLEHAFLIGVFGSFAASIYSSISGQGAIYYEIVVILIAIYTFGQAITTQQIKKQTGLANIIPGLNGQAHLKNGTKVSIDSLQIGQELKISPNDNVPVDGIILSGTAYIEQQAHTGETYPQVKSPGDSLLAGSLVLDGEITLRATSTGKTREIDRLLSSLTNSTDTTDRTQRLAQKILNAFVPTVLGIALFTGIIWTFLGHPHEAWLHALTVTVVACPCALGVAIPLATKRGLATLKLLGIIPKQADFIDRLAEIDTVAFDKTGTLSDPRLELRSLELTAAAPANLEKWIAAIQQKSTHPVARPFWKLTQPKTDLQDLIVTNIPGRGIKATFKVKDHSHTILIGNHHLLNDLQITYPKVAKTRQLFILSNNQIQAIADLEEYARSSSVSALKALIKEDYQVKVLTGDSSVPTEYCIPEVLIASGLTSSEKAALIRSNTLYIGDGLNDCESFKNSYANIALKSGNDAAREVAQATLLHDDLSVIPTALAQIRTLKKNLQRILLFSFVYNTIGITLAAFGILHPIIAAILMFASSLFVISCLGETKH